MSLKTSHLKAILLLIFIALIVCWDLVLFDLVANVFGDFVMGKRFLLVTVGLLVNLALILTGLSLGRGLQQRTQSDQDSELTQKESSKADQFSHSSPLIAFLAVGVVFPALVIFTAFCFYAAMFSFQRGPISFRIGKSKKR